MTDTNFSSHDPSHSNLVYNLGQNKMEQQANPLPPLPRQIKDEAAQKPKRAIFLSKIWGGGWGKRRGINFQSLLSKIFLLVRVARRMDFVLHGGVVFPLCLSQFKEFLGFKNYLEASCSLWLVYGKGRRVGDPSLPSPEP